MIISVTLTFDYFVTSDEYFRQHSSCVFLAPVLILNLFFFEGSIAKNIRCINKNSSGARNTSIKTYSLHNIIFNEYLFSSSIYAWIFYLEVNSECPNRVFPVCGFVNIHLLNTKKSSSSLVFILKMNRINSCESNHLHFLTGWWPILCQDDCLTLNQ